MAKHYKTKRLGYLWVKEQERAKLQHPSRLIVWIETRWQAKAHRKPHTPANCFMVVRRGDSGADGKIMDRLSYLAKTRGKGYRADSVNDYSGSLRGSACRVLWGLRVSDPQLPD